MMVMVNNGYNRGRNVRIMRMIGGLMINGAGNDDNEKGGDGTGE